MLKKGVSYLILSSLLLMNAASCVKPKEDEQRSSSPTIPFGKQEALEEKKENLYPSSSINSGSLFSEKAADSRKKREAIWSNKEERAKLLAEVALQRDISQDMRLEALKKLVPFLDSLDTATRIALDPLARLFIEDKARSLKTRMKCFSFLETQPEELLQQLLSELQIKFVSFPATRLEEVLQQSILMILTFITDPQESLRAIHELPADKELKAKAVLGLSVEVPKAVRFKALQILLFCSLDKATKEKVKSCLISFISDEEIPLKERTLLMPMMKTTEFPITTLLSLGRALDLETEELFDEYTLNELVCFLHRRPHPEIQQKVENYFFKNPIFFLDDAEDDDPLRIWLIDHLEKSDESKRTLILQKIGSLMQSAKEEDVIDSATFLLNHSKNPNDQETATQALWNILKKMEIQGPKSLKKEKRALRVCKILLRGTLNPQIRQDVLTWLLEKAKEESSSRTLKFNSVWLYVLTTEQGPPLGSETRHLIEHMIDHADLKDPIYVETLLHFCFFFKKHDIEQDSRLKIQEKLLPEFKRILFSQKQEENKESPFYANLMAEMFLKATDEETSHQAYEYLKDQMLEGKYTEIEDIIDILGIDHPWTQEAISIITGHENSDHPHSSFRAHRQLLEKVKEPVEHHPSSFQLADERLVTFNLETLKTRRSSQNAPHVKHSEFIALARDLVKEIQENPRAQDQFAPISRRPPRVLLKKAKEAYFRHLLDSETEKKQTVSLESFKLRRIIADLKALKNKSEEEKQTSSELGLSPSSQVMAQLLTNVMECDTNKDDGIDNTYRSLGYAPVISEEDMRKERLIATAAEFIREDLRQMREGLLAGEGLVVKHLLFGPEEMKDKKVEEPPHQAKYLRNLLGDQIGTFLEGQKVAYDSNGGYVQEELRSYIRQEVLDTLYLYHKPEDVIQHYLEKFNTREFKIGTGGKDHTTELIMALIPNMDLSDPKYSVFDQKSWGFIGYTPLLVAEIFLKLNILQVIDQPQTHHQEPSTLKRDLEGATENASPKRRRTSYNVS